MTSVAISKVAFENFRCIRNAVLELGPMTVLVGGNGTGKSTVLRAVAGGPAQMTSEDVRALTRGVVALLTVKYSSGALTGRVRLNQGVQLSDNVRVARCQLLHLDLKAMREPNNLQDARILSTDGQNMANVLFSLSRPRQQELAERFCALVPHYADIGTQALQQGFHTLRFEDRWSRGTWYLPNQVSDGTMLVFAYLLLLYQEPQVDLIAIEEPERGLHPYLLGRLVGFLREIAHGRIGERPVQIVMATHSAELLNHVEPDEVRFLSRDEKDGGTIIERAKTDTEDWRRAFTEYDTALGSMWLSGGLGGVPGR
jgi:predicted ATPase